MHTLTTILVLLCIHVHVQSMFVLHTQVRVQLVGILCVLPWVLICKGELLIIMSGLPVMDSQERGHKTTQTGQLAQVIIWCTIVHVWRFLCDFER